MSALPALSLLETRVLGVLVEKQHTVPDSYPLTLNALAERKEGALVGEAAKQPGARETRWAHLVSGEPALPAASAPAATALGEAVAIGELAAMKANVDQLQKEVAQLREVVARLAR